mgnify:CR=1 FL=1
MTKHVIVSGGAVAVLHFSYIPLTKEQKTLINNQWNHLFGKNSQASEGEIEAAKYERRFKFDKMEIFFGESACKAELTQSCFSKIRQAIDEGCSEIEEFALDVDYYS